MKGCTDCGQPKGQTEFYRSAKTGVFDAKCKECRKAYQRAYYVANRERAVATNRLWAAANPERVQVIKLRWQEAHGQAHSARYYQEHRDELRARSAAWKRANMAKVSDARRDRRAKRRAVFVEVVRRDRLAKRDGMNCALCGELTTKQNWSVDHIIPISKGGEHSYANTQLAHRLCNARKGAKVPTASGVR